MGYYYRLDTRLVTIVGSLLQQARYYCRLDTIVGSIVILLQARYYCRLDTIVGSILLSARYYCRLVTIVGSLLLQARYYCRLDTIYCRLFVPAVRSRILQRSRRFLRYHLHQVQLPRARRHLPSPHRRLPQLRPAPATFFSCYSRARHLLPLLPGEVYRGHLGSSLQEQISAKRFFSTLGLLFFAEKFFLLPESINLARFFGQENVCYGPQRICDRVVLFPGSGRGPFRNYQMFNKDPGFLHCF